MSPLIGRLALAWYFLRSAIFYAGNWDVTVQLMALKHIPAPPALLALALIVMFLGGISLVLGYQARYGAILLFGFTIAATLLMHDFWTITKAADQQADFEAFAANVAIAGGLLVIVGLGPGGLAIDNTGKKR
jgi:putative oxidoreductase